MKSQGPFVKDATDWELLQMKLEPNAGDMYYTGSHKTIQKITT